MVLTPEQRLELIEATEKMFAGLGIPNHPLALIGIEDEQIFSIDGAIAALQEYKARETRIPIPISESVANCPLTIPEQSE